MSLNSSSVNTLSCGNGICQYLVADAQTIFARQEVGPNLVVAASGGQNLNEGVSVENYVAHVQKVL